MGRNTTLLLDILIDGYMQTCPQSFLQQRGLGQNLRLGVPSLPDLLHATRTPANGVVARALNMMMVVMPGNRIESDNDYRTRDLHRVLDLSGQPVVTLHSQH